MNAREAFAILRPEPVSRLRARRIAALADRRAERSFVTSLKGVARAVVLGAAVAVAAATLGACGTPATWVPSAKPVAPIPTPSAAQTCSPAQIAEYPPGTSVGCATVTTNTGPPS